jgi:CHAT domain-containing protein/Tfp pilus assembly protein PilF
MSRESGRNDKLEMPRKTAGISECTRGGLRSGWLARTLVLLALSAPPSWAHAQYKGESTADSDTGAAVPGEWERLIPEIHKLYEAGRYGEAIPLAQRAALLAERTLGAHHLDLALSLNLLAVLYVEQDRYGEAEPLFKRVLRIREKAHGLYHPGVAVSLNNLAALYWKQGRYGEVELLLKRALGISEMTLGNHHENVAAGLNNLAALYLEQGRHGEAEPLLERALGIVEKALGPHHRHVATSLNNLAALYREQGRHGEAEPLYQRALRIQEKALGPHHPTVLASLGNLAELYEEQGRHDEAEPLLQRALGIREKALGAHHPDVARSLNSLTALYWKQGRYGEAEPLLKRALGIREKALGAHHPDVARSLNELAALSWAQGRYEKVEPLSMRALGIQEKALGPYHLDVAESLTNLSILHSTQGQYWKAEPLLQRALSIQEKVLGAHHPNVARSLNNLAMLYLEQGRYAEAEPLYVRALGIEEKAQGYDHPNLVKSPNVLATLSQMQDHQVLSRPCACSSLNNLAALYFKQQRYSEAEPLYVRALELVEKTQGAHHPAFATSLHNLATLYEEQGRYGEAESLYVRAQGIYEKALGGAHPNLATNLNGLALLYRAQGRYREAETLLRRALGIAEQAWGGHHPNIALHLNSLAVLYLAQRDFERTITYLERAERVSDERLSAMMRHGSEQQKHAFMAMDIREVDVGVKLALRAPGNARAQSLAMRHLLRRKGRVLDAMRSALAAVRGNLDDDGQALLDQYLSIRSLYAMQYLRGPQEITPEQHQKNLVALEKQKREIETQLSEKSRQFAEMNRAVTLEDVQHALPEDAELIEWIRYQPFELSASASKGRGQPARYAACVLVRRGAPRCMDLGNAKTIEAAALAFHRAVALGLESRAPARKLDAFIMAPVRRRLGGARKLYLSPDGALQFTPFAALVHRDGNGLERYLIEQFELVYVTGGRDLVRAPRTSVPPGPVTVLGDPRYSAPGTSSIYRFPRLPGTHEEAAEIGALFAGARVLTDANASEGALKNAHAPSILHLATHAYFGAQDCAGQPQATDNPLLAAGLALAGANACHDGSGGDGVLTGEELAGLDLYGTQLVVLSACDTGIGDLALADANRLIGVRDGVYGLRRALMLAGAETQVVSLWKVKDLATQELMSAYYRALLQGRGRAEALRQVQLAMLRSKDRAHPYYWASFAVVGMDGPLRLPQGQVHPGTTPRGPRGCACDVRADSSGPGWATFVLALAVLIGLRARCRSKAGGEQRQ